MNRSRDIEGKKNNVISESFQIIDSTLREGEQFYNAQFTSQQRIEIADRLDQFGVDYIEITNPIASPQSLRDARTLASRGYRARVVAHTRCHVDDVNAALEASVDGINMVIGTSPQLQEFSHGKSVDQIIDLAQSVLSYVHSQAPDVELRFSTEDSFRSRDADLLRVYLAVDSLGFVDRVGVADTVGIATPVQVHRLVSMLRRVVGCDIEFHGHDDSGCAIANSLAALEAGATHIDTSVLGIGERNGITPLGGFIARLYTLIPEATRRRYQINQLRELDTFIARTIGVEIPFNNYVTGVTAFSHKAGIHTKAVLNNPSTYEAFDPSDFGIDRSIAYAHRLTGWNAVQHRATALGLTLEQAVIRGVTEQLKMLADQRAVSISDIDALLRAAAGEKAGMATPEAAASLTAIGG